jgi:hypothetical protein
VRKHRLFGALLAALVATTGIASAANVNVYARGGLHPSRVAPGSTKCQQSGQGFHCSMGFNDQDTVGFGLGQKECWIVIRRTGNTAFTPRWDVYLTPLGSNRMGCAVHKTGENDFEIFPK